MSTLYSIGSTNQLSMTLRQYGFTDEDVVALTYFDLEKVRRIIYGLAGIKQIYDEKYIIHKIWNLRKKISGNFFTRKSHDINIMNSLADALERNKYSTADVTKLKQFNNLRGLLLLVRNRAEIDLNLPVIDCVSEPELKEGWSIYGHKKIENYEFDSANILLKKVSISIRKSLTGKALADKLLKLSGPNANVADWLPKNTNWISKEWEKVSIVFPNTIFLKNGEYYARYIFKLGETWHSHWCVLTDGIPREYRIATF
jgi:hypothetical protein